LATGVALKCHFVPKLGVPKFLQLGFLRLWKPITFHLDLQLGWDLKQSCIPHPEPSNDMWQATCTQVNKSNSLLLMEVVKSQIGNLTPDLSFGHNLCFKYPNESCDPILNISISRSFQSYKEIFNPMNFYLYNYFLKIRESIKTPTPKVGAHLGMCGLIPSHSPDNIKCDFWFSFFAHTFASPYFGHKPKAKVMTIILYSL